jgi:hypothetical protein
MRSAVLQSYMGFERRYHARCASSKVATVQGCHGAHCPEQLGERRPTPSTEAR